jgi:ABC-type multidrug transport system permease subunit
MNSNNQVPGAFENTLSWLLFAIGAVIGITNLENDFLVCSSSILLLIAFGFSMIEGYTTDWNGYLKNAREKGPIE